VLLECIRAFGNVKPGETVEVPEGAVFDTFYFKQADEPKKADKK
jgi:hypothetical protein